MKREQFIRELKNAGCELLRHGARHDIFINLVDGKTAPVPRHREIKNTLSDYSPTARPSRSMNLVLY